MSHGRHSAGHGAGRRRSTSGSRKAVPGARKAAPEARRASPTRAGGAKVVGRRVADGDGRPAALAALGSGEKIFALLPLAILSVASVAGLATNGDDGPEASASPAGSGSPAASGSAAGPVGHESAHRQVVSRGSLSSARAAISETASPVVREGGAGSDAVEEERVSIDDSTAAGSLVEPSAEPPTKPAGAPESSTATASPSTAPDVRDTLTGAEATALCLESGISTLDAVALEACADELLG